jgi:hypothetical protein
MHFLIFEYLNYPVLLPARKMTMTIRNRKRGSAPAAGQAFMGNGTQWSTPVIF